MNKRGNIISSVLTFMLATAVLSGCRKPAASTGASASVSTSVSVSTQSLVSEPQSSEQEEEKAVEKESTDEETEETSEKEENKIDPYAAIKTKKVTDYFYVIDQPQTTITTYDEFGNEIGMESPYVTYTTDVVKDGNKYIYTYHYEDKADTDNDNYGQKFRLITVHRDEKGRLLYQEQADDIIEEYEYDKAGNQIMSRFRTGKSYSDENRYEYNAAGQIVFFHNECYINGKSEVKENHYEYSADGKLLKQVEKNDGLTVSTIYEYEGKELRKKSLKSATNDTESISAEVYSYDSAGNLLSIVTIDTTETEYLSNTYKYDENGNLLEECFLDYVGNVINLFTYAYSDSGDLISEEKVYSVSSPNSTKYKSEYTYDDNHEKAGVTYYFWDAEIGYYPYTHLNMQYDEKGNRTLYETIHYYDESTSTELLETAYTYDERDRIISITSYENGELIDTEEYDYFLK